MVLDRPKVTLLVPVKHASYSRSVTHHLLSSGSISRCSINLQTSRSPSLGVFGEASTILLQDNNTVLAPSLLRELECRLTSRALHVDVGTSFEQEFHRRSLPLRGRLAESVSEARFVVSGRYQLGIRDLVDMGAAAEEVRHRVAVSFSGREGQG